MWNEGTLALISLFLDHLLLISASQLHVVARFRRVGGSSNGCSVVKVNEWIGKQYSRTELWKRIEPPDWLPCHWISAAAFEAKLKHCTSYDSADVSMERVGWERQSKVSDPVKDDDMRQEWSASSTWWGLILPGCRQAPPRPLCTAREYHVQRPLFVLRSFILSPL
jgi:hypothetical protein